MQHQLSFRPGHEISEASAGIYRRREGDHQRNLRRERVDGSIPRRDTRSRPLVHHDIAVHRSFMDRQDREGGTSPQDTCRAPRDQGRTAGRARVVAKLLLRNCWIGDRGNGTKIHRKPAATRRRFLPRLKSGGLHAAGFMNSRNFRCCVLFFLVFKCYDK